MFPVSVDSDSRIAWHRAQLKKNREALKVLEVARFRAQHDKLGDVQKAMLEKHLSIDYVAAVDPITLKNVEVVSSPAVIAYSASMRCPSAHSCP